MMICDECKSENATLHTLNIVNGIKSERHLCAKCQAKLEAREAPMGGLAGLFSSFADFSGALLEQERKREVREVKSCPLCSISIGEVLKRGFLGCPRCYDAFIEMLMPMIQKVQSGTMHRGKSPGGIRMPRTNDGEILRLKKELANVVAVENYEEAALIQAKLRILEGGGHDRQ